MEIGASADLRLPKPSGRRRDVQRAMDAWIAARRAEVGGLHLGCGDDYVPGMVNCDLYAERADLRASVLELPSIPSDSVAHAEAHHVIEHLGFADAARAAREWSRVLAPGGTLVVSCPNLDRLIQRWVLRPSKRAELRRMIYGSQEHPGMFHQSGYSPGDLAALLQAAGLQVMWIYTPYPARPTPSLCIVATKR
ncbi:MAG: methyltransferase domain-containing protein [Fimbriimonadaceae bacterium]|nr:methyltransferase domain-containing protein [Fimbriimonadaceae bacterium]